MSPATTAELISGNDQIRFFMKEFNGDHINGSTETFTVDEGFSCIAVLASSVLTTGSDINSNVGIANELKFLFKGLSWGSGLAGMSNFEVNGNTCSFMYKDAHASGYKFNAHYSLILICKRI